MKKLLIFFVLLSSISSFGQVQRPKTNPSTLNWLLPFSITKQAYHATDSAVYSSPSGVIYKAPIQSGTASHTITYAVSVTIDWSIAQTQIITLTGNCAFTNSSATSGELLHLKVIQDATGSRTISFAALKYPGGVAPVLSSSANAVDILTILYDGTNYNLIGVAFDVK